MTIARLFLLTMKKCQWTDWIEIEGSWRNVFSSKFVYAKEMCFLKPSKLILLDYLLFSFIQLYANSLRFTTRVEAYLCSWYIKGKIAAVFQKEGTKSVPVHCLPRKMSSKETQSNQSRLQPLNANWVCLKMLLIECIWRRIGHHYFSIQIPKESGSELR